MTWIFTTAGAALMACTLLDVFMTVLYARIGSGLISRYLACWLWRAFRGVSSRMTIKRDTFLSFCGPVFLVALVVTWMLGLTCGAAMIVKPRLGTSIRATNGRTPTDFGTAMYVAGDSLTTVGAADFTPQSTGVRLFYTFNSFVGISFLTLTLTYFLEIYNALQRRNTFSLKLHLLSAETGDAAEMIALIGAEGRFDLGYSHLVEIAAEATNLKESHHFYPALFYCRFREVQYALSRVALICLDAVSLMKSALDDDTYAWLKKSAAMEQLWRSSMHLLTVLAVGFLPRGLEQLNNGVSPQTREKWRDRYRSAIARLNEAHIATFADVEKGEEIYIGLRLKWDRYISEFAAHLAHRMDNIDIAVRDAERSTASPLRDRLHAVG